MSIHSLVLPLAKGEAVLDNEYSYQVPLDEYIADLHRAEASILALLECTPSKYAKITIKEALRQVQRTLKHCQDMKER